MKESVATFWGESDNSRGGGIAEDIIPLLEPFKCEITVIRKRPDLSPVLIEPFQLKELRTVLPATDVLLVALALTNETENLIGANELKLLPESAVIVNVAEVNILSLKT
ncbi:MAG: hypothetical protein CM15mP49_11980 [Actinomycetota bacterium]|nr:MAG: hypothetical protein CM15mP49_11980 [Actinomycetota bacterium]